MKDPQLKDLMRSFYEAYTKNNEYASIYDPIHEDTATKLDAIVAYIKLNY